MPQRGPKSVPSLFVLALAVASCAASAGTVRAAEECIAKPNAPAPQGQHWYYRTNRDMKRQCWYLGPEGVSVQKSVMVPSQRPAPDVPATPVAPPRAQQASTTVTIAAPAFAAPAANTFLPVLPLRWPEAKFPDVLPTFQQPALANQPQSTHAIAPAVAPASNRAELAPPPVNTRFLRAAASAQHVVEGDHTFALIMIMTALLAVAGPVFHAARWRRGNGDRHAAERLTPCTLNTSFWGAPTSLDSDPETAVRNAPPPNTFDQTEKLAQSLRQLVNEMQTKQYARVNQSRRS